MPRSGKSTCYDREVDTNRSQKVKSASHTSFSVLGLGITLGFRGLIILLELTAEPILKVVQRRYKTGLYQRLEWVTNETLQLQRMAHEGLGAGSWTGGAESVPTTSEEQALATLDISDQNHPRLIFDSQSEKPPHLSLQQDSPSTNSEEAVNSHQHAITAQSEHPGSSEVSIAYNIMDDPDRPSSVQSPSPRRDVSVNEWPTQGYAAESRTSRVSRTTSMSEYSRAEGEHIYSTHNQQEEYVDSSLSSAEQTRPGQL